MKYFILKGQFYNNLNEDSFYLNETQLRLESFDIISINFDVFLNAKQIILFQKHFSGEFRLSPCIIKTMDGLKTNLFYLIRPTFRIETEKHFKINKNWQKIIDSKQIIINDDVHKFFLKNNIVGYNFVKYNPPIKSFAMQLKFI